MFHVAPTEAHYRLCNLTFVVELQKNQDHLTPIFVQSFHVFNVVCVSQKYLVSCKACKNTSMSFKTQWQLEITDTEDRVHLIKMDAFPIQSTPEKEFEEIIRGATAGLILRKMKGRLLLSNSHRCSFVCGAIFNCQYFSTSFV